MDVEPPVPPDPDELEPESGASAGPTLRMLTSVVTLVVALCAIGLSLWEGYEYRRHNRLSVMPQLQPAAEFRNNVEDSTGLIRYNLLNAGLGPAVLEDIIVYHDSTEIFNAEGSGPASRLNFDSLRTTTERAPVQIDLFTYSRYVGEMLQAGERHLLFEATIPYAGLDSTDLRSAAQYRRTLRRFSYVFCYCSVYGDHCGQVIAKGYGYAPEGVCGF